ncbi:MAG: metal-dependent hydrolase [Bacillota bacterium]
MKITRLGHAMYLFQSNEGNKYLVDPFFDMNPGCPEEFQTDTFFKSIDAVFLTHGHFDHTSGLSKIKEVNPDCLVIAQYELAMILIKEGYENLFPINLGGSFVFKDLELTMVQAKHTSSYRETEGTPLYAGESSGYILDFTGDHTVYHSGDTALMLDMKLIQDFYKPTIAILSSSGQFTMGPKEAAYAVEHLLDVEYVIPSHTFPTKEAAVSKETLAALLEAFPVVANMVGRDKEFASHLADYKKTKPVIMGYGEEVIF